MLLSVQQRYCPLVQLFGWLILMSMGSMVGCCMPPLILQMCFLAPLAGVAPTMFRSLERKPTEVEFHFPRRFVYLNAGGGSTVCELPWRHFIVN